MSFVVGFKFNGRIFFAELADTQSHFFFIALCFGSDSHCKRGCRIFYTVKNNFSCRCTEGIACIGCSEFCNGTDVACTDISGIFELFAFYCHDFGNSFCIACSHVDEGSIRGYLAGDNFEIRKLAYKRIGDCLEYDCSRQSVIFYIEFNGISLCIKSHFTGFIFSSRCEPNKTVEKLFNAVSQESVTAEYRADCTILYAVADTYNNFFRGELFTGEVFFKHFITCFSNSLIDSCSQTFKSVTHVGNGYNSSFAVYIFISLVFKKIDIAVSLTVNDIGNDNRAYRRTKRRFQAFKYTIESCTLIAETVDKENLCKTSFISSFYSLFRADTDTVLAGNSDKHGISSSCSLIQSALKVKESGSVDDIDFLSFPLNGSYTSLYRGFSFDFLSVKVADSVSVTYFSESFRASCKVYHSLSKRSFA